jgi:hypothetical protein
MSSETASPDPALNAIEAALCSLGPAASLIDRELVMYRAGQASMRRSPWGPRAWNAIAASLALVALGEGMLLARRPPSRIVEKLVLVQVPATAPALPSPDRKVAEVPMPLSSEDSLSLGPAGSRIDRELVMYRAGQASMRRSPWGPRAWNAIAASLALVALGEGVLLARRPPSRIVERVVVVHVPATAPVLSSPDQKLAEVPVSLPSEGSLQLRHEAYERLTSKVLRYGLDGLPASPMVTSPASGPASSGQMLHDELRRLLDPGDPS